VVRQARVAAHPSWNFNLCVLLPAPTLTACLDPPVCQSFRKYLGARSLIGRVETTAGPHSPFVAPEAGNPVFPVKPSLHLTDLCIGELGYCL